MLEFFILLTIISLDVRYYNFANSYKEKNSYHNGNSPTSVGQSLVLV